ncbi:GntR family transcriptional regulator [Anaerobacillus sp. 1_MG-2023]|uniref:GntR family transcriptional regulator n=1 Tax=Anaerobacillus sp. 1_MG-2023 TaxID=3062655 RepID=UPI0026E1C55C|nr:GntR family transcriptional regulator [Anaerobacillus sp. 1_MG-2023]MDO6655816.1 GntR family transcriptional regulator [Anaerobacillus sp. 1_MG-2023]
MRKETVEQKVYQLIKNAILTRQIAPGNQLFENAIAAKVNASRTPIRSAITKLEAEGLVTVVPNKGAFIVQPTIDEMIQAFELRKVLEDMAIREGYAKMEASDIERLKQQTEEMGKAFIEGNILLYHEQNKAFHLVMAKASGNRYLIDFMEQILNQITIYMVLYDVFRSNDENDIVEHNKVIQLLEANDEESLHNVITNHLENSLAKLQEDKLNYQSLTTLF